LNFSVEFGLAQSSRKDAKKEIEARNPNIKSRNNFQTNERQNAFNVPNKSDQNRRFEFSEFWIYSAAICFGFSASDFGLYLTSLPGIWDK
jgi:hypothetical protein